MNFLDKYSHFFLGLALAYVAVIIPHFIAGFLVGWLPYYFKELEGTQNTRPKPEYKGYAGRLRYLPQALLKTLLKLDNITALVGAVTGVVIAWQFPL